MEKIIITGSKGTIGGVLMKGLKEYQITSLDLPEQDARNYQQLLKMFPGHKAVIHLAWDTETENWKSGKINPDNCLIAYNVYQAALESGVPRLIMASSIHADEFLDWKGPGLLTVNKIPVPTSPYGANKIFVEALGRHYAKKHKLEIICIRFGGVNPQDIILPGEKHYDKFWLSHMDCVRLVKKCLEVKDIPNNFVILYGVSNNKGLLHDISNPLGWIPKDSAS